MNAEPRVGGRVVLLNGARTLEVVERPVPEPGPGEALVRISSVGICGTDVHGYLGRADRLPMTLGHDAVGVVAGFGPGAGTGPGVGARVTIDPMISCDSCAECLAGRRQLCPRGAYLGMTCPGTMADYLTVPAHRLVPVPPALSDTDATVLEPVAVALHLLGRIGGFAPASRRAHVIGGGPLGVLLAQTLAARGWAVRVHEPQAYRRAIAAAAGLEVHDATPSGEAADGPVLIVETSASAPGVALARSLAAPGSLVALVGRAPADFSSAEILLRELTVLGVRSGVDRYPESIALVAAGSVTPARVVTHEFGLADAAEAFDAVTDPSRRVMRAVLHTTADRAD